MNRRLLQMIGTCLWVIASVAPVSAQDPIEGWAHFSPQVISDTDTGRVKLLAKFTGTFTEVRFQPAWSQAEMPMTQRPDGVWELELGAADLAAGLTPADAHRRVAGRIRVYNGAAKVLDGYQLVDVLTDEIPPPTIKQLGHGVQASLHLFNLTGTYDTPLEVLTQKLYEHTGDQFDFINVVFDEGWFLNRLHVTIQTQVRRIGRTPFDNSAAFGSAGRLLGVNYYPTAGFFDLAEPGFLHETGHQWVNYLTFEPLSWRVAHWPLSSMASDLMGWAETVDGQGLDFDYRFQQLDTDHWQLVADHQPKEFSDLSLYLMGLIPSAQVRPQIVFENQNQPIEHNAVWTGPVITVDGATVAAQMGGERSPACADAPKDFNVATILVTKDGLASPKMMRFYDWCAARAALRELVPVRMGLVTRISKPFYLATRGLATMAAVLFTPFDLNWDAVEDFRDRALAANFLGDNSGAIPGGGDRGDVNGDGRVDAIDLVALHRNAGR